MFDPNPCFKLAQKAFFGGKNVPDNIEHSPPAGLILLRPSEEGKNVMLKLELQKSLQDLLYYVRNPL